MRRISITLSWEEYDCISYAKEILSGQAGKKISNREAFFMLAKEKIENRNFIRIDPDKFLRDYLKIT